MNDEIRARYAKYFKPIDWSKSLLGKDVCRARARKLRRDAELMVARAEVIEAEADTLSVELVEFDECCVRLRI